LDLDEFLGLYSSSNIFGVNELKAKRSIGHVACIGGSCDRLDVGRNVTWVFKSAGCKSADSNKVTGDSINAAGIVNTGMNNLSPYVARNIWTKWTTITVSTEPCLMKYTRLNSVIAAHLIHMKDATPRDLRQSERHG